jgi:predicted aldo/keto reductase-like oxidoreductase
MSRPTKLTPELQDEIVKIIRAGNYIETASAYVGINKTTLYAWLKRGAKEKERVAKNTRLKTKKTELPYVEFSNAIEKALAQAEIRDVTIIGKAAEHNWQAAAWRLERKFHDRWGRKDKQSIEHTGKDGGAIETNNKQEVDLSKLSDKELENLENIIGKTSESKED